MPSPIGAATPTSDIDPIALQNDSPGAAPATSKSGDQQNAHSVLNYLMDPKSIENRPQLHPADLNAAGFTSPNLNGPAGHFAANRLPDTTNKTEKEKYDIYAKFVADHGSPEAKKALADGQSVIVGLRIPVNSRENQGRGLYNDKMAVVWAEKTASGETKYHAADFKANTQPSAQYEDPGKAGHITGPDGLVKTKPKDKWAGDDVNHEGRKALGELVPGTYKLTSGQFLHAAALKSSPDQVVYRDTDHRGVFPDATPAQLAKFFTKPTPETWKGDKRMHIHRGATDNTWSAGCQTLPSSANDKSNVHEAFFETLHSNNPNQKQFYFVLVTLNGR